MRNTKRIRILLILAVGIGFVMGSHGAWAEKPKHFRQENGLRVYEPPKWFLNGYFLAREKDPDCLFGTVEDFVKTLNGRTTWLIEDQELERVKKADQDGRKIEYSLFLEEASPDQTVYWVFVVFPYETADDWYRGRRAYHGRKAEAYYGKTRDELKDVFARGYKITGELRFLIEMGELSSRIPEDAILKKTKCRPVLDLHTGLKPE
ncbi:MAG: hypothetical protein P8Y38_01955 [Deltaproteobacteria bacterium]|jgi:hypothetical protein